MLNTIFFHLYAIFSFRKTILLPHTLLFYIPRLLFKIHFPCRLRYPEDYNYELPIPALSYSSVSLAFFLLSSLPPSSSHTTHRFSEKGILSDECGLESRVVRNRIYICMYVCMYIYIYTDI